MHSDAPTEFPRPLALITGASSGIGADLARELARDGHDLVLVSRREKALRDLAVELAAHGARSTVIAMNLGTCLAAAQLGAELENQGLHKLDALINDAGFGDYADFLEAEPTKLSEMLQLNVVALTELTRLLLPGMVARRRGRVLLVGATAGLVPGPGTAVYNATKAYVLSLGEALASELRGSGVTLTTLCPGPTSSGFCAAAYGTGAVCPERPPWNNMESADVARQGYLAMKKGQRLVIPGLSNKLGMIFARYGARSTLLIGTEDQVTAD